MKRSPKNTRSPQPPAIMPGDWRGEIAGSCSVNFGQTMQDGPPRQPVEFTYLILPAFLTMPEGRFTWPGVLMIMTPTPLKKNCDDAGRLFKTPDFPALSLALDVTRAQFSDLIPMLETQRLKHFHFTLEAEREEAWPVRSWGMAASFG